MKSIINALFFFYLIIFLNGCKDNPVGNSSPIPNSIKNISTSNEDFTEYHYNGKFLVKKEMIWRGELMTSITFTYNKGQLVRKDDSSTAAGIPLVSYLTYEYSTDNKLIKTIVYIKVQEDYKYSGHTLYEYDNNKLMKHSFYNVNNELRNYHILKYNNDNIIEDAQYDADNKLQYLETYEYDNKINPLTKDMSFISAFTMSKNNIINWINTYYTVSPPNIYISTSNYTYNNFGYPIRCVTVYNRNENGITSQDTSTSYYEYY